MRSNYERTFGRQLLGPRPLLLAEERIGSRQEDRPFFQGAESPPARRDNPLAASGGYLPGTAILLMRVQLGWLGTLLLPVRIRQRNWSYPLQFEGQPFGGWPLQMLLSKVAILQSYRGIDQPKTLAARAQVRHLARMRGVSTLFADKSAVLMWSKRPEIPSQGAVGTANDELGVLRRHGW